MYYDSVCSIELCGIESQVQSKPWADVEDSHSEDSLVPLLRQLLEEDQGDENDETQAESHKQMQAVEA